MRKSLIVLLIVLLLSAVVLAAGVGAVSAGQDQITVTQTTLAGDLAAAEGLQVRTVLNENSQLYWHTDYKATAAEQARTEFRFYQQRQDSDWQGLVLDANFQTSSVNFGISGLVEFGEEDDWYRHRMLLPAEDVASRTAAGETKTEIVRLRDYYAYYPVQLETNWLDQWSYGGFQRAQDEKLADCFRIPVSEDVLVEITVTKDDAGQVVEVDSWDAWPEGVPENYEAPYTYAYTVATEEEIYLLLAGNEDYSQLRDGFGVYRIPVTQVSSWEGETFQVPLDALDMDSIENIFPLDPARDCRLERGVDDTELLIFEETENGVLLHVLDTASCRIRQTVEVGESVGSSVWFHEKLMIIGDRNYGSEDSGLWVFRKMDGVYTKWLETAFYPLNDEGMHYQNLTFAFDGTRLAMADFERVYNAASHRIIVYDQTGLCYAGDYHYNSDHMTEPLTTFNFDEPLLLQWTD